MRKIILIEHTSLDGYAAGPKGEMDWIKFNDELFDLVDKLTHDADAAMYGRVTYEMMDAYWPEAGNNPDASIHAKEHSKWYNKVEKIVLSHSMDGTQKDKTTFISSDAVQQIQKLKNQSGKNILLLGSPSVVRLLCKNNLIDEYRLFVNPVILGKGIPVFPDGIDMLGLELKEAQSFPIGVTMLHYTSK